MQKPKGRRKKFVCSLLEASDQRRTGKKIAITARTNKSMVALFKASDQIFLYEKLAIRCAIRVN